MSNEPNSDPEASSEEIDADDVQLKEQKGFSKRLVQLIAASPVILILLGLTVGGIFVLSGSLNLNFTVSGTLPVTTVWETVVAPFLLFVLVAFAFVWLLSVMAWFGASGVIRIGRVIEQMVQDYSGGGDDE